MYDVIGDIHGYYDVLHRLMVKMGYRYDIEHHVFTHPEKRKAIFVGDFIDRGPDNVKTVRLVRNMVNIGAAYAIMGNHDYNAVLWATPHPDKPNEFQRPHSEKHSIQHKTYLDEVLRNNDISQEMQDFFKSLPVYLQIGNANIVHACWAPSLIRKLHDGGCLDNQGRLTDKGWRAAGDRTSPYHQPIEVLLKGPKDKVPNGDAYPDAEGVMRTSARLAWWNENPKTYGEAFCSIPGGEFAKRAFNQSASNDMAKTIARDLKAMPNDQVVFIGHIWQSGQPKPLSQQVICVDYSIGAFRIKDMEYPRQGEFVYVPTVRKRSPILVAAQ